MRRPPLSTMTRYGYALILVALATVGRLALDPVLGDRFPFATLFFAVLIVAGSRGLGPAMLATVLGALASARFLLPPRDSFAVHGMENQAGLVLFVTIGLGIALLGGAIQAARRRAEESVVAHGQMALQLRERVDELETLLDIIPIGVWQGDASCGRIVGNRAGYEMLRLPAGVNVSATAPESLAGEGPGLKPLVSGREVPPEELPMQRAARTGRPVLGDILDVVLADGTAKSFLCNVAPVFDGDGKVRGVVGAYADITDRRRAEEDARKAAEIFKLVHSIGRIGHWEWNSLTDQNNWSPEIQALYGLEPGTFECTYDAWAKLVHPDDWPRAAEEVRQALETGRYFTEFRVIWPDGSVHWLEARAFVFQDGHGKPVRIMGVNMDITERKRIEEALKEADRRKDEFLATLAHELRNPLAPIRNAVEILTAKGSPDPESIWARDVIGRQVGQMARLLEDLLDVSRISRSKLELRKSRVTLAAVVDGAVETSRPPIEGAGHELAVTLPDEPVYLDADPARLAQVFSNLLNNAAKYTEQGGHIRLTAERRGGEVFVSVSDTGIGIAPGMLPSLFEMFSQATPALERSQGGLGIGLALVKGLVEMHGGTIEARSDGPGRGSEFVVRLPAAIAPRPQDKPSDNGVDAVAAAGRRVLVADDNRDAANSLAMMLRIKGNEVRTAHDGQQAVVLAGEFRPDLVLLDIEMPTLDGYQAARRIREQPWGQDMTLVALTGWGQEEDRQRAAEVGFDSHMVKPVDPAVLEKLLGAVTPRPE